MKYEIKLEGFEEAVKLFEKIPEVQPKIVSRSMNESARTGITAASKKVRSVWNIKAGRRANKQIGNYGFLDVIHPKRATAANPEYQLRIDGKTIPLLWFGARDLRASGRGVSFRLKKTDGARGRVKKGFIAVSRRKKRPFVLVRKTPQRYPLRPLTSISAVSMVEDTRADKVFFTAFLKAFKKNYLRNAKYYSKNF